MTIKLLAFCFLINSHLIIPRNYSGLGGYSIDIEVLYEILTLVPENELVLELGSGAGSEELLKHFKLCSVEHDLKWLNKYHKNYIYAPIVNGWYDCNILKNKLPKNYKLILVDGPPGSIGRMGFFKNIELFDKNTHIIFDDVNRIAELNLLKSTSAYLNRPYYIKNTTSGKQFGVILKQ